MKRQCPGPSEGNTVFEDTSDANETLKPSVSSKRGVSRATVASFFAGIGGFDRAFELEKAKIVFHCEKDKFCLSVLQRHWPSVQTNNDICELTADSVPNADIWTAGFPCQDVSLARGHHGRSGLKGNNTSLFFKLADLVAEKQPKVLLLENVVGLLNSHGGMDFAIILRKLTSMGYGVAWRVMNARYFGAPQSRPRVFICAWKNDYVNAIQTLFEDKPSAKLGPERAGFVTECIHSVTGAIVPQIAYCVSATSGRHTGLDWARTYISYPDAVRRPTPTESERLQGFPAGWSVPSVDYKIPVRGLDSERYRAVGNAVAVPVVRWIARRMLPLLKSINAPNENDLQAQAIKLAPDLNNSSALLRFDEISTDLDNGQFKRRWKSGGCAFGNAIFEGVSSTAPSKITSSSLVDALDDSLPDERYFLTSNAAIGVLRRCDALGRNLFRPMRRALEILASTDTVTASNRLAVTGGEFDKSSVRKIGTKQRRIVEGTG